MSIEDIKPDTSLYTDPADRLIALGLAMKSANGMQRRAPNSTGWENVGTAKDLLCFRLELLAGGYDYRVAPPKPRERWAVYAENGSYWASYDNEFEAATVSRSVCGTYAKFIEVL